jgi:hypothetical protein
MKALPWKYFKNSAKSLSSLHENSPLVIRSVLHEADLLLDSLDGLENVVFLAGQIVVAFVQVSDAPHGLFVLGNSGLRP